jgi:hypothetical protein
MMRGVGAALFGLGCLVSSQQGADASGTETSRMMERPVLALACDGPSDPAQRNALCRALQRELSNTVSGYIFRRMEDLSGAPTRVHDLAVVMVVQDDTAQPMARLDWRHGENPTFATGRALQLPSTAHDTPQAFAGFAQELLQATPDLVSQAEKYRP